MLLGENSKGHFLKIDIFWESQLQRMETKERIPSFFPPTSSFFAFSLSSLPLMLLESLPGVQGCVPWPDPHWPLPVCWLTTAFLFTCGGTTGEVVAALAFFQSFWPLSSFPCILTVTDHISSSSIVEGFALTKSLANWGGKMNSQSFLMVLNQVDTKSYNALWFGFHSTWHFV